MATPVFCCGFECGVVGTVGQHFTTPVGAVAISTITPRSGARSLRANPSAASTQIKTPALFSSQILVARFYIYFNTLPNANLWLFAPEEGNLGGVWFNVSDSKIYARSSTTNGASGFTVTTGQWYRVDVKLNASNNPILVDVSVNATALGQSSQSSSAFTMTTLALFVSPGIWTGDVYIDDLLVSQTAGDFPLGPGYVNHFVPTADGTHNVAGANDFERSNTGTDITNATTTAFQLVDDVPLKTGTPTEYINLIAPPNATDYVEVVFGPAAGISTPTVAPRGVEVIVATAASATGTNNIRLALNDNGTTDDVANGAFHAASAAIVYNRKHYVDPPSAASAWTVASGNGNFNNIRLRCLTSDAAPDPWLASVMIEAEFLEETNIDAQPGVGVLTIDGLAPTAVASDHKNVLPDVGSALITGIEPTAVVNTIVAADVGALLITGIEPTVVATANQNIDVPTGALIVTGIEPTAVATANQFAEPGVGDAIITGILPTVTASDHINVAADVGALLLTGIEPTAIATANQFAEPGVGDLLITGLEPTVAATANQNVLTDVGALILTGIEPTVTGTANQSAEPGVGDLIVTGLEPTADVSASQNAQPDTGALIITGIEPIAATTDHQNVLADVGSLVLDGFAPVVSVSDLQNVFPDVGSLLITGFAPTIELAVIVLPGVGVLLLDGFAPSADFTNHQVAEPGVGLLIITGIEPMVSTGGTEVTPDVGVLIITGFEPIVIGINPKVVEPGTANLFILGFAPTIFIGAPSGSSIPQGSRERLRMFFRRRQLTNEDGNVIVQCNPDGTAEYVPGLVDQTWEEFTTLATGLDKLSLSWDQINSNTSGETSETSPAGSNYDKGISASITVNDAAFQFIYDWLLDSPCGTLNAVEVMITDDLCKKRYRTFEIKADNLNYSPYGSPCEFEVKLRESDPVWHCIHKTFIWDNWQNWFTDGSSKVHPCFLTAVEARPRLMASARMGLSIFGRTIPLVSLILNETDDAFRRIQNVDNFVDAPLIRDIITNVCDKCELGINTMFHDPASDYYDLCLFYPGSGAMHTSASSAVTSPGLSFHFANRWDITLAELLDKLKVVYKAEWYVTPNNTLVFQPKGDFLALAATPIIDFTVNDDLWDKYSLNYTFNGNKKPAYGRYQYNIDASDLATQESKPLYNDIVDYDGPANNLMLEGNISKTLEFASTGAVRDGLAKEDYLRATVSDGETVAYALIVVLAVIIASLFAGTLSIGAAIALAAFLGVWVGLISGKANSLRTLFGSSTYTGAIRLTTEQVATPRLIIWDGVSFNRAKMVSVAPGSIAANSFYNPTGQPYTTRNKFQYSPSGVYNYPMYFESYFLDNLYDRFHDDLDNPLKSMDTHQTFDVDAYLCCEVLDALGIWENEFAKIGYFVKMEARNGYDVLGRIEHFEVDYDGEKVSLRGQVYKIKT